jgi:hypothetical protein
MDNASHDSEQDRERTAKDLAGEPGSRSASTQSANIAPSGAATSAENNNEQYNKITYRNSVGSKGQGGTSSHRDLGSVGGGSIPGGNSYGGMSTGNSTTDGSPSSPGVSASEGASTDRGSGNFPGMHESPGAPSASGQSQQGTLGGRNPGQTQNQPIGDQDTTFGHRSSGPGDNPLADPMTSRAPDKVNQAEKQEEKRES